MAPDAWWVADYLRRIGYGGGTESTLENLRAMHRAHFLNVPFENLDIARGVTIEVDERVNARKLVERRRGGFCLEVTGMFARMLRALGYRVDVIGAQVEMDNTGTLGAESSAFPPRDGFGATRLSEPLSHMIAIVHLDERWIADVGFGGRIAEPLRLDEREPQRLGIRTYVIAQDGNRYRVMCEEPGAPSGAYQFVLKPRRFDEFYEVCTWLQTSPDSRFTHGDIVSLATPQGRVTLAEERLIVNENGERVETPVASEAEKMAILRERFGIIL
jgi:N-hydroxyarylamine O-acetyltransferase